MADSANITNLSRRRALLAVSTGVAAASVLSGIAVPTSATIDPAVSGDAVSDGELIEMCRGLIRFCRAYDRVSDQAGELEAEDPARHDLLLSIADRIHDHRMQPLAQSIADLPAASWAGVAAKAGVLASDQPFAHTGDPRDLFHIVEPLVASMVRDAVRLGALPFPGRIISPNRDGHDR